MRHSGRLGSPTARVVSGCSATWCAQEARHSTRQHRIFEISFFKILTKCPLAVTHIASMAGHPARDVVRHLTERLDAVLVDSTNFSRRGAWRRIAFCSGEAEIVTCDDMQPALGGCCAGLRPATLCVAPLGLQLARHLGRTRSPAASNGVPEPSPFFSPKTREKEAKTKGSVRASEVFRQNYKTLLAIVNRLWLAFPCTMQARMRA